MKITAIGARMHSGWGALVAVSMASGTIEVIDRRRISVTIPGTPGGNQPYHYAANLELSEAENFVRKSFETSKRLATEAIRDVVAELSARKFSVVGAVVLLASEKPLPPLAKILVAHPLLHTAEGQFFRRVFSQACETLGVHVIGIRERDLDESLRAKFGTAAVKNMKRQISVAGRKLGPPWTQDQKAATQAALAVLGEPER